jgi:hypothetical protein
MGSAPTMHSVPAPDALRDSRRGLVRALADGGAAVLSSSHVTATLERLCDRVAFLQGGQCARVLPRAHWGPAGFAPSPLEREFLAVAASQLNLGQEST